MLSSSLWLICITYVHKNAATCIYDSHTYSSQTGCAAKYPISRSTRENFDGLLLCKRCE
jgi:hypothetical protein